MSFTRTLTVCPFRYGKTYFFKGNTITCLNRDLFNITKSPERYINESKTEGEFRGISESGGGSVLFHDILFSTQTHLIDFFQKGDTKFQMVFNYLNRLSMYQKKS